MLITQIIKNSNKHWMNKTKQSMFIQGRRAPLSLKVNLKTFQSLLQNVCVKCELLHFTLSPPKWTSNTKKWSSLLVCWPTWDWTEEHSLATHTATTITTQPCCYCWTFEESEHTNTHELFCQITFSALFLPSQAHTSKQQKGTSSVRCEWLSNKQKLIQQPLLVSILCRSRVPCARLPLFLFGSVI